MLRSDSTTIDRAGIAQRIPHAGTMCLLDRVLQWDADTIRCSAVSHRDPDNPLRARGRLSSVCGIEYAAQAMAVHGALCAAARERPPRVGLLTSVRGVSLIATHLDDVDEELAIVAERLSGDARAVLYAFTVSAGERPLLSGRAAVILDADAMDAGA